MRLRHPRIQGMRVPRISFLPAGIFGNATGGRRGAIIGGIAHGFFITLLPALLVTAFNQLGFINATATDVDTVTAALLYFWILNPIFKMF